MTSRSRVTATAPQQAQSHRVAAIIVNYQTTDDLERCLAAFDAQDLAPDALDIIVVDNASSGAGATLEKLAARTWRHRVRIIANRVNRGFAGAVNDGLAASDSDVVVFANVDVDPAPDAIRRCLEIFDEDDRCGSVQPLLVRGLRRVTDVAPDTQRAPGRAPCVSEAVIDTTGHVLTRARIVVNRGEGQPVATAPAPGLVFGVSGAFAVHRRAMLDEVAWRRADHGACGQVLTEALFAFFEDVELDWRARRFGWHARFAPEAVVYHERGGRGARRSSIVEELNWANRLLVTRACDDRAAVRQAAALLVSTSLIQLVRLTFRQPIAAMHAVRRWVQGRGEAARRGRELDARAPLSAAEVLAAWERPFSWRAWIGTWMTRRADSSAEDRADSCTESRAE